MSIHIINVTNCMLALEAPYHETEDAPTCLQCVSTASRWERILRRVIERRIRGGN